MDSLHSSRELYESDYSSGEENLIATIEDGLEKIEPLNMHMKIGYILDNSFAARVFSRKAHATWESKNNKPKLRTFCNKPIHIEGKIRNQ